MAPNALSIAGGASPADAIGSIQATAVSVGRSWLGGRMSTRFARVALEREYSLSEKTREELVASRFDIDPLSGAQDQEAETCERLSGLIALLHEAIDRRDSESVARVVDEIGSLPPADSRWPIS